MLVPYCASTAADSRLLVLPLPNRLSGLVKSVPVLQLKPKYWQPVESAALPMSVVYVLPRVGSLSWYVEPDSVSCSGTVPEYSDVPEPSTVSTCCSRRSTWPERASTYVASRLGVPSAWTPPVTTSHARRGVPEVASTTRRVERARSAPVTPRVARDGARARDAARAEVTPGVVETR